MFAPGPRRAWVEQRKAIGEKGRLAMRYFVVMGLVAASGVATSAYAQRTTAGYPNICADAASAPPPVPEGSATGGVVDMALHEPTCTLYVLVTAGSESDNNFFTDTVVQNAAEHQWIIDRFLSGSNSNRILGIGGSPTGQPLPFAAWQPGQPDNAGGCSGVSGCSTGLNECRIVMNWHFAKGLPGAVLGSWNDVPAWGRSSNASGVCTEPPSTRYLALRRISLPYFSASMPTCVENENVVWQYRELRQGIASTLGGALLVTVPVTYAWERNGQTLADGPTAEGSIIAGATTGELTLTNPQFNDEGLYTLVITGPCGIVRQTVRVYVNPTECSSIDHNRDGVYPDPQDVVDFIMTFGQGGVDFNRDDIFPADEDITAFFSVLAGGPCIR
jgi:hypothetical protein